MSIHWISLLGGGLASQAPVEAAVEVTVEVTVWLTLQGPQPYGLIGLLRRLMQVFMLWIGHG